MNKGGWPSSIVNQVKGYAIKSPTLSDCIYDQMIDSFISEKSSIEEIALLLNKTTINHLGTGRAHFMAIAWTACLRLKGKFSDKELHLLWKQMMKKASEFKQKEKLPPFFSALEKVINRPSISLEHIEDLMALSGLLSLACSNSGLFGFENHLGVPMIRLKTQNLCFNLPFDPSGCLSRISTRTSLHNADLVELCELMYSPQVFGKLSPLEIERPTLTLDFEKWKPYARTFLETSLLKTHGLDLLNLIFTFNPTEEEAFTLLTEVQTLIMQEGKGSRLEQIYHTFKKASQLYPETPYLTDSVIFLETLLQENSNTKKLSLFIRQSSHSPSVFLKKLSSFYIKACQVSFGYTLIDMLLTEGAHNEAAKIMKRLQRENPNRNFNKEWPLFIRLLEKSKDDSHQLIKVGKLALNILELSEGHKDDLSPLLKLIRELWNDPTSLDLGFELFKNLSLKNPSLQENILMEACEKALESKKGISLAFELWQSSSRRVAEKDRKSYEKFCFTLFERLEQYELSEVSNLLKDAKQGIADLNSQNILLKLETIELEQLLKKEDWESALKLIQTISERSRVTELESFDTFLSLLEKCLIEIPLNDPLLSKVLTLFKSRSLEKVLKGQSPDLFSLLSFSLKRMEEECPQSLYLKPLLFLVLSKIKTAEDFSGSAALTLQLLKSETLEIKKNSEKWELLLSHFLQTKQFHSFGLLVVLLYQHKLTYSENIFKDAGQCIKELAALHPKLGFEVFSLLFEKIESPLSILPTLIESPLSFNFLPLFKKLKLNSKSFSLLLSCLVKKKDHQNHYHLLLSYSSSSADWKELLKQLDPTSLLYKKVNLFVLKFSPPKDESPSEQILQVLEGGHDDEMIQLALQCSIKHKVTTLAVWRRLIGIFQTHSTFKGQAHLPSTLLFPLLLENGHPDLWTLFLETSLNLTGRHWFSLMKNLPVLKDHFGAVDQSKRETLYTKLLARALLIISQVEGEKTHCELINLRSNLKFLSPQKFNRQDFYFLADSIERGGVSYFTSSLVEIREAFPTFLNGELNKLFSLVFPAVCNKFYELISKRKPIAKEIEGFILFIFEKGLDEKRLETRQFDYELPLLVKSFSDELIVKLARKIHHAKGQEELKGSILKHTKLIQNRLFEIRTPEALDLTFDFIDSAKDRKELTATTIEIFQQATLFSHDLKEKAILFFCDIFYSEENRTPASLESALAVLLASTLNDSPGSWPLFLRMCTKVFATINLDVWEGNQCIWHPCPVSFVGLNLYFGKINPKEHKLIGNEPESITHNETNVHLFHFVNDMLRKEWRDFAYPTKISGRTCNKPTKANSPNFYPILAKVVAEITNRLLKYAKGDEPTLDSRCVSAALEFNTAEIIELYMNSSVDTKILDSLYSSFAFDLSFKTSQLQFHCSLVERLIHALKFKNTLHQKDAESKFSRATQLNTFAPLSSIKLQKNPDSQKEYILELIHEGKDFDSFQRAIEIFNQNSGIFKTKDFRNLFRNIITKGLSKPELWDRVRSFVFSTLSLKKEEGKVLFKDFFVKACSTCKEKENGKQFLQQTLKKALDKKLFSTSDPLYKELLKKMIS